MAAAGFKGLGWILFGVVAAPGLYLVTSQVAAERARVEAVERAIVAARRDIRDLETEFQTRANFAQLERWNGDVLALAAPRPEQYAGDEAALASLSPDGLADGLQSASLVVPAAVTMPTPQPAAPPEQRLETAPAIAAVEKAAARGADRPARAQAVAMLDKKLLDDATLGDLMKAARAESGKRR